MFAPVSTPKAPLALKARKAISYPLQTGEQFPAAFPIGKRLPPRRRIPEIAVQLRHRYHTHFGYTNVCLPIRASPPQGEGGSFGYLPGFLTPTAVRYTGYQGVSFAEQYSISNPCCANKACSPMGVYRQ